MADADAIRRREIRKRKILEHSEARLSRITSTKKNQGTDENTGEEELNSLSETFQQNVEENTDSSLFSSQDPKNVNRYNLNSNTAENSLNYRFGSSERPKNRTTEEDDYYSSSSNGATQRSCAADNYIFPKKVSDAETRSFVRSRCDARRNSTCTQMMMETFRFSSFSLSVFRPWIAAVLAIILKGYFLLFKKFLFFQTLLFPYFLMEVAYLSWTKFETQINSRQATATSSFIAGVLILCGIPLHVVSGFSSVLYLVQSTTQDLAAYIFSFIFFHFICETYM